MPLAYEPVYARRQAVRQVIQEHLQYGQDDAATVQTGDGRSRRTSQFEIDATLVIVTGSLELCQNRGELGGLPLSGEATLGLLGSSPSRCSFLRASFRARLIASARSRTLRSDGFS